MTVSVVRSEYTPYGMHHADAGFDPWDPEVRHTLFRQVAKFVKEAKEDGCWWSADGAAT